jgi:hypothetical protein
VNYANLEGADNDCSRAKAGRPIAHSRAEANGIVQLWVLAPNIDTRPIVI